jgi:hypothetical protein
VARNRRQRRVLGAALVVLGAALVLTGIVVPAIPWASEFFAVDACLDAHGSYDYVKGECDYVNSHPYIPSPKRLHATPPTFVGGPLVLGGSILLVAGATFLLLARLRPTSKAT